MHPALAPQAGIPLLKIDDQSLPRRNDLSARGQTLAWTLRRKERKHLFVSAELALVHLFDLEGDADHPALTFTRLNDTFQDHP